MKESDQVIANDNGLQTRLVLLNLVHTNPRLHLPAMRLRIHPNPRKPQLSTTRLLCTRQMRITIPGMVTTHMQPSIMMWVTHKMLTTMPTVAITQMLHARMMQVMGRNLTDSLNTTLNQTPITGMVTTGRMNRMRRIRMIVVTITHPPQQPHFRFDPPPVKWRAKD